MASFTSKLLFGGATTDDSLARREFNANNQRTKENVVTTTSRVIVGPAENAHFSLHIRVGAGSAPVGTLTVWYSNMPNPDPDVDDDWVVDPLVSIDMAVVSNTFLNFGNVTAEAIRVKVTRTSGTISLNVIAKSEGV